MKLSIIIPTYNANAYLNELCLKLIPQLNDDIEVLIIDDGSRKPYQAIDKRFTVYRKENGGVSSARNLGLDKAKGEYVAFIDADDIVSKDFIKEIEEKIALSPDVIWLSWETFGNGWQQKVHLKEGDVFPSWNLCVWNRVYKRSVIGDIRFNEKKQVAEDAEFIRDVKVKTIEYIEKPIYFYRTEFHDSLTQRIGRGLVDVKRVVYYLPEIKSDMKYLIGEVAEADKEAEVVIMTYNNHLPELSEHAMIIAPQTIYGTELRGDKTDLFKQIPRAIKTQVVIYIGNTIEIGGVETWIINFCYHFHKLYDIIVAYSDKMFPWQIEKLSKYVLVHKLGTQPIICDTFLNMRITDKIPEQIRAKQIIQVCHTCKMKDWHIQEDYDKLIYVSKTCSETFKEKGDVIHNLTMRVNGKEPLLLITASRFTFEKGLNRMYKLAETFKANGIDILWLVFTNKDIEEKNGIKRMLPTSNIRPWMRKADYLVQLSDMEAYCYSIVEALEEGTPVITTPISVLPELGFRDKKDGYIVPFDMLEVDVETIANKIPKVNGYDNGNDEIVKQWREVLGDTKPLGTYNTDKAFLKVRALEDFGDLELSRYVYEGEVLTMRHQRAIMWLSLGKVELVEGD